MNKRQRLKLLDSYCHSINKGYYKKALKQNEQIYYEIYSNLRQNDNRKNAIAVLKQLKEDAINIKGCLGIMIFDINFQEVK